MADLPPTFTVRDAMALCGLPDDPAAALQLFMGATQAERLASDVFNDDFTTCMDKTFTELDSDFKTYSDLTQAQGQIRMVPGVKNRVKAFVQWVRDEVRYGRSPTLTVFPVAMAAQLIRRYKTHEKFVKDASSIADAAKPKTFTEEMKWEDWVPTFLNYLRLIPGRDGVPLKYICRENDQPDLTPHNDFLDDYIAMAPLAGEAFAIDSATVHTFIVAFIAGNATAENKIQSITMQSDGRLDFQRLKEHYEGVGVLAFDITEADRILKSLFYSGEKHPTMWWGRFETQLTKAFTSYDKKEGRQVYSDAMKLRILISKVDTDFLKDTKAGIQIALTEIPMRMTYERALASFRNQVNMKFPPQLNAASVQRRQVRGLDSYSGRSDRGRGGRGGRGRGGRGGRGKTNRVQRTRTDSEIITLTDGQKIEYHPSFKFPGYLYAKFKQEDKDRLRRDRTAYRERESDRRTIRELQSRSSGSVTDGGDRPPTEVDTTPGTDGGTRFSQLTGSQSMMGGRNEQASQRQSSQRRINAVKTIRHVRSARAERTWTDPPPNTFAYNETDSNADTCVLGKNFKVLQATERIADVYAYDDTIAPTKSVPIVTGATAYDHPSTGETYILIFHESLYYGERLNHSLINPNQVRHYGVPYWDNPFDTERGLCIEAYPDLRIRMFAEGTKIRFSSRVPTDEELATCPHIDMTSRTSWNPSRISLGSLKTIDPRFQGTDAHGDGTGERPIEPIFDLSDAMNQCRHIAAAITEDVPLRRTFVAADRHSKVTAESLADRFCIGPERAKNTLRVTTQRGTRSAILPISRRYRADRYFSIKRLNGKFATDTAYGAVKSIRGNIASQIYSHKCGFKKVYHLQSLDGNSIGNTLAEFANEFGAPEHLTYDGAQVQVGTRTRFAEMIRRLEIKYHVSSPRRPDENPAEAGILELKKRWYRIMVKKKVPTRLWDFGFEWVCETGNLMWNSSRYCDGRTPLEVITGETPDITEYLDFGFYDWVIFRSNAGMGEPELGRWLGVSHRIGQQMSYWILPPSGRPVSAVTVQRLTNAEQQTDEWRAKMAEYTNNLEPKFGATNSDISDLLHDVNPSNIVDIYHEDQAFTDELNRVIDNSEVRHADIDAGDGTGEHDTYLNMELGLPRGEDDALVHARVTKRMKDDEGNPVGLSNVNPLLDSRQYEVTFHDGHIETLSANIIAENLLAQVDEEGRRQQMLAEIIDHRVLDDAITKEQGVYKNKYGVTRKVKTTKGWEVLVQWKDGSTDWVSLKDMKDSYPVFLARYARDNGISDEPAFAWWVSYTLNKERRILAKIKTKYWSRTHKYGIRIPKNMKDAKEIDDENGDTLWMDAIRMEMKNNRIAFVEVENPNELVGYTEITGHLVFDIKLGENFRRKARFCADGHKTGAPSSVTYSTVVSRDSVRIVLLLAALNGLEVLGADIQNAFLTAPNKERCWIQAGPEFGPEEGKCFIVARALYGLKSAGFSFRSYAAQALDGMGFRSTTADPDVWIRPAVKPDGEEHYEYIMMYVDDMIAVSMNSRAILEEFQAQEFKFKNNEIAEPKHYLGARLECKDINEFRCWTISSLDYVKAAVANVEKKLAKNGKRLPMKVHTPMNQSYIPEMDGTPELDAVDTTYFQELIGVLRWATELGRVDILLELSLLSQYQASPREGHMEQLLRIFAYLKKNPKLTLYMNPELPRVNYAEFRTRRDDFAEQYRDATEEMPHRMPKARGRRVSITAFADASHGANKKTRKSHTGFVIFVNRAPITWYSKRQSTVEASTFSSEFIAMKTCVETIENLRFKLRMFGVPLDQGEPTQVYCDNESVVSNSTKVESRLNKKHSAIAYHYVRWCVAAGIVSVAWIDTHENLADAFTKRLPIEKREYLFGNWTY